MKIVLYHAPGACSRVPLNALEEIGLPFEDRPVALLRGEQKLPGYLAINPKGKVPALLVDDMLVTENAAILAFLAEQFPDAHLLPYAGSLTEKAAMLGDLVWCGGTLHPIVRQMMRPTLFSEQDPAGAKHLAINSFAAVATDLSDRLQEQPYWYGSTWSIVDVYIYWVYSTARVGGFPLNEYAALLSHSERVRSRASFQRALEREKKAVTEHAIPLPAGATVDNL